jgi:DNA-binding MarR family transcriptional regulator
MGCLHLFTPAVARRLPPRLRHAYRPRSRHQPVADTALPRTDPLRPALGELRKAVDEISDKMLNQNLRTFELDGLVSRTSYPEVPPRVEYSLTPLGRDLVEHMLPLTRWIATHADDIVRNAAEEP